MPHKGCRAQSSRKILTETSMTTTFIRIRKTGTNPGFWIAGLTNTAEPQLPLSCWRSRRVAMLGREFAKVHLKNELRGLFMVTKSRIISDNNIGEALSKLWEELCANDEVRINVGGAAGGVTLISGKPHWWARDKDGKEVKPAERSRICGCHEVTYSWLRGQRPAVSRKFGPPPPPQRDGFLIGQPDHLLSIMRRAWLSVNLGEQREIGCVVNGFPFVAGGHFLALIAKFTDGRISYPWAEQCMSFGTVKLVLDLALRLGPEYAVGFNPPYYGATQAQFHVHLVKRDEYPVERAVRVPLDAGGAFPLYAGGCLILESASPDTLSGWLARLGERGIASNLLIRKRTAYVFPRRPGVGVVAEFPAGLIAFSELSGHWITSDESVFDELDEDYLRTALRRATIPVDEAWGIAMGRP